MAFDLDARPGGEYPEEYYDNDYSWPDGEYDRSPSYSAKFARDSDLLSPGLVDDLHGSIEPHEALRIAGDIEEAVRRNDAEDPDHLQKLAGFAHWLRYWGNRGVYISGGP